MAGSPPFQLAGKSENPLHFSAGENVVHCLAEPLAKDADLRVKRKAPGWGPEGSGGWIWGGFKAGLG